MIKATGGTIVVMITSARDITTVICILLVLCFRSSYFNADDYPKNSTDRSHDGPEDHSIPARSEDHVDDITKRDKDHAGDPHADRHDCFILHGSSYACGSPAVE